MNTWWLADQIMNVAANLFYIIVGSFVIALSAGLVAMGLTEAWKALKRFKKSRRNKRR